MSNLLTGYQNATGKIDYTLTNNYMFHVILQSNELVLRGLISSLLHLPLDEIDTVQIKNPIEIGESVDMKEFILDIYVLLNNNTELNLEMQVNNLHNWPDRSLSYLCRSFDSLYSGQDYRETKPVIHIGILDFTLFPKNPEFYATYKLLNIKNHQIFNDKFRISVISLKQIELATEEDKEWNLDIWAKFFAAKTWKEIKMLAENNNILTSATESLYKYNSDWLVRERCRAREDYENHELYMQREFERLNQTVNSQKVILQEKEDTIQQLNLTVQEKDALIAELQAQLAAQEK